MAVERRVTVATSMTGSAREPWPRTNMCMSGLVESEFWVRARATAMLLPGLERWQYRCVNSYFHRERQ